MSTLSTFFKGSDTKFGIFYPNHYLVSVFRNLGSAQKAVVSLRNAGFPTDDVIAVPGNDVIELAKEEQEHHPVWATLMKELSKLIGTEEAYTERDLELARRGAGYLAVYCPNEASKRSAWAVLSPMDPVLARYYSLGGIEHLSGEV